MVFLSLLMFASAAAPAVPMPLYSGKAPMSVGDGETDKPTLTAYVVPKDKASGAAVVICPGGGYGALAMDHEGKQPAVYLNSIGISAFVLKYRIIAKDRPGPLLQAPLLDAQRALRMVRANAAEYGIDPKKVGIWGFSAGGHLASTAATHFSDGEQASDDPIERVSCRPDFAILAYPVISMKDGLTHAGSKLNLLGKSPDEKLVAEFCNELHVTAKTPPTFIFHTDEDPVVFAQNPALFYLALKAAKIPAEFHVYEKGPHGLGLGGDPKWNKGSIYAADWTQHLSAWLKLRGVTRAK